MWYGKEEKTEGVATGKVVTFGDDATVRLTKSNMAPEGWNQLLDDITKDSGDRFRIDNRGWVEFSWESMVK
jgi:hypothetical protein